MSVVASDWKPIRYRITEGLTQYIWGARIHAPGAVPKGIPCLESAVEATMEDPAALLATGRT